jgi:hypothetical protein
MKKWFVALTVILVLLIASIYIFIPLNLNVSNIKIIKGTTGGAYRCLSNEAYWNDRWPEKTGDSVDSTNLTCDNYSFKLLKKLYNALEITAASNDEVFSTKLIVLELNPDSIALQWQTSVRSGMNPVDRVLRYWKARDLKKCMSQKLSQMKSFLQKNKNVYGFDIQRTTLQDTVLVSTKYISKKYPTTTEVYTLIKKLKDYISTHGAVETNFPMLNIISNSDSTYLVMAAIATNRALQGNSEISLKRLARYQNKVLTTEVKGGPETIRNGFAAIESYMGDYHLTPPVIPFELLVTDRSKEMDSTRWITRIYYPII